MRIRLLSMCYTRRAAAERCLKARPRQRRDLSHSGNIVQAPHMRHVRMPRFQHTPEEQDAPALAKLKRISA